MDKLRTRLRTWFPSARWARRWRSPRGDGATASPRPGPVGYLVNHPGGLAGVQGIGHDYVLGSGGVYVQSQGAHLTARVPVAPGTVRGLAPVAEKVQLTHGPIPASLFELGLRWFQDAPDTERFFAVRWDGRAYRLVVPTQAGTATRTRVSAPRRGGRPSSTLTEALLPSSRPPTTGTSRASASTASVGRLDDPLPELRLRVGVYGHFAPLGWPQVFGGPDPPPPPGGRTRHTKRMTRR